ncbi:hypothetical protein BP5796_04738 [Coleophoma crateriformis]|uniref:Uncharacterized protein n=1 Tax=Coleophoma crateriformis TaxID=565419 RepID=A0A3D8SA69_9HELO|nr:hypothetical protein BP5796_04738 [Coleophoma crateriformis]
MRRKTRKSIVNLVLFGGVLLFILYLNASPSSSKVFVWNEIRYKTAAAKLPDARGICPSLAASSKPALVVSRMTADGDPTWLQPLAELYHLCVYTADAPADKSSVNLQVPANRGHEAMGYLTFLIDNYAHIPTAGAVFVHGSRWAWHNDAPDYDNVALLAQLNVSRALAPWGYHNLRCDWSLSTCPPSAPSQGSLETSIQAKLDPWDSRAVSDAALPGALADLFGDASSVLGPGDAVRSQCCAQFAVSRERIWQHSREEYVALRQWLLDGSKGSSTDRHFQSSSAAPSDDRIAGRILSYVWHILFIKQEPPDLTASSPGIDLDRLNSQACPSADACYCLLYGRCNLDCPTPGSCRGQYELPKDLKLPVNGPASPLRESL